MGLTADDRFEIQNLYGKYSHAVDFGDADGWARTFTPDGVFVTPGATFTGYAELAKFVTDAVARRGTTTRHFPSNVVVDPTAAGASGKGYFALIRISEGGKPGEVRVTGRYQDELVRTADGWRFSRREAFTDA
jgi:uncharacterized protein (TIGR02246 family)